MSWLAVVAVSVASWMLKLLGYLVPEAWVSGRRVSRMAALMPVGLLAGLVAVSTLATNTDVTVDARVAAVLAAAVALLLRAPFLVVLLVAAVVAASLRALGWAA
jgi:uncharacterized membrane protein